MQHPIQETGSLRPKPNLNQRAYGKRCVPQPAVAVVPIKVSADTFWKGSGGSGNDRARRSKNHELQRECASHDLIAKLPFILAPRRPALPLLNAGIDALRDLLQRRQYRGRILGIAERKNQGLSRMQSCPRPQRRIFDLQWNGAPHPVDSVAILDSYTQFAEIANWRNPFPIASSWDEIDFNLHFAGSAGNLPDNFMVRNHEGLRCVSYGHQVE